MPPFCRGHVTNILKYAAYGYLLKAFSIRKSDQIGERVSSLHTSKLGCRMIGTLIRDWDAYHSRMPSFCRNHARGKNPRKRFVQNPLMGSVDFGT